MPQALLRTMNQIWQLSFQGTKDDTTRKDTAGLYVRNVNKHTRRENGAITYDGKLQQKTAFFPVLFV